MSSKTQEYCMRDGDFDKSLHNLYPGEDSFFHRNRWMGLIAEHEKRTGNKFPRLFSASGRTELAGNHTDHNNGRVLAAGIQLDTIAAVNSTNDGIVQILSEGYPPVRVDIQQLEKKDSESGSTAALVRGIAASIVQRGGRISGFTASITSRVLQGSGLSSSAALEVLIASIYSTLFNRAQFTPMDLALMGQEAENNYFDKPSGLMDQTACAVGGVISIDFADSKNPVVKPLKMHLDTAGYTLVVVDTGGDHVDLTGDYTAIPTEMRNVASFLGGNVLRDINEELLQSHIPSIRKKFGDRAVLRAMHFFSENKRVDAMAEALQNNDVLSYLEGVRQSGDSSYRFLQNIFISQRPATQAISLALALTEKFLEGSGACRVHGGGFAGTIQTVLPSERLHSYITYMEKFFGEGCVLPLFIRPSPVGEVLPEGMNT